MGASEFFAEGGAAGEDGPVDIGGDMRNYQDAVMYHRMKEDLCELMYINVATGQQQKGQYETRIIRQPRCECVCSSGLCLAALRISHCSGR